MKLALTVDGNGSRYIDIEKITYILYIQLFFVMWCRGCLGDLDGTYINVRVPIGDFPDTEIEKVTSPQIHWLFVTHNSDSFTFFLGGKAQQPIRGF